MNKSIFKVFLVFSFFLVYSSVYADTNLQYEVIIEDDANLLSTDEINKLKEEISPLTSYGNVIFKSISDNNGSASSYAGYYYHSRFSNESGTLFLIDMDNREIYIFSDGYNYKIINKDKAYIITDNVYRYATSGDYYKCASYAFSQIKTLLDGGKILEPMRYISNFTISIIVAFFICYFIVIIGSRKRSASYKDILSKSKVSFAVSDSSATKTGSHRVYDPVSDSSSSSGGFSGGGGGGSSGGGGGHGF